MVMISKKKYIELEAASGTDIALQQLLRDIGSCCSAKLEPYGREKWSWKTWSWQQAWKASVSDVCAVSEGGSIRGNIYRTGQTQQEAKANLLAGLLDPSSALLGTPGYLLVGDNALLVDLKSPQARYHRQIEIINDMPAP